MDDMINEVVAEWPKELNRVTKYPTGMLGLSYMGSGFYYSTNDLKKMLKKLKELRLEVENVEWMENYFDGPCSQRGTYKTKPYNYKSDLD